MATKRLWFVRKVGTSSSLNIWIARELWVATGWQVGEKDRLEVCAECAECSIYMYMAKDNASNINRKRLRITGERRRRHRKEMAMLRYNATDNTSSNARENNELGTFQTRQHF